MPVKIENDPQTVILDNFLFKDSTVKSDVSLVTIIGGVQELKVSNIALQDFTYKNPEIDTGSYFLNLGQLKVDNDFTSTIKNITTKNYGLGVLKFGGFSGTPTSPKQFIIEDMIFADVIYKTSAIILWI